MPRRRVKPRSKVRSTACLLVFAATLFGADATYDGSRVHYESYGKGREAVVFIHGWTCDLTFWRGQAPVYEKRRSLLVDLPGRAIDAVMQHAGVDRAVLVGHSMGGPVVFTFLRLFPSKTKAIVFVDAQIPQTPKDDAERAAQAARMAPFLRSLHEPTYRETANKMIDSMFTEKTTPAMREEIRSKMSTAPQYVMASALEGNFALEPPKPDESYQVPFMAIMAGSPRPAMEKQLRAIFPNLRKFEAWQGSGHFLMMESPERFNSAMEQFLATL